MAPVALRVKAEAQVAPVAESGVAAEAVSTAPKRSTAASPQAARVAPPNRNRATARPKGQTSSAAVKSSGPAKNACDGSGLLTRAWCALTPCKARGRSNPECIERLRAEAARQQRIERQ
jgi:hypothetical protein